MIVPLLWMITIGLKSRTAGLRHPAEVAAARVDLEQLRQRAEGDPLPAVVPQLDDHHRAQCFGGVLTAMMAGYALARLRFPGRKLWFYLFVGSMLLPGVVGLIPLFQLYKSIGWYDTWLPLIVPAFLGGNPLFIFLARQYFLAIPYSIDEAAKIDGAGHLRIFVSVMLPLTRPAWLTMAILAFQASWNDYLNPLVYLYSSGKWPLSVGMAAFVSPFAGKTPDWSYYMATNLLYMLPPLIIFSPRSATSSRASALSAARTRNRGEFPVKRTLGVTALACAGLLAATACSGSDSGGGSSSGPVTVTVMTWESAETNAAIKKALADFKDDNITVQLLDTPSGQYGDKLASLTQAKKLPDLFWCGNDTEQQYTSQGCWSTGPTRSRTATATSSRTTSWRPRWTTGRPPTARWAGCRH
jgi:ABC-type glycerol-3-phosphate transport system permease component